MSPAGKESQRSGCLYWYWKVRPVVEDGHSASCEMERERLACLPDTRRLGIGEGQDAGDSGSMVLLGNRGENPALSGAGRSSACRTEGQTGRLAA